MSLLRHVPVRASQRLASIVIPSFRSDAVRTVLTTHETTILKVVAIALEASALLVAAAIAGSGNGAMIAFAVLGLALTRPDRRQAGRLVLRPTERLLPTVGGVAIAALVTGWLITPLAAGPAVGFGVLGLVVARGAFARALQQLRMDGRALERAIVVGGGPIGIGITKVLRTRREFGLEPIGYLETDTVDDDLPTFGTPDQLPAFLREHEVRRVIVVYGRSREQELVPVLRACDDLPFPVNIHVLPRFFELGISADDADDLWGFPLVPLRRGGPAHGDWRAKRIFDVIMAGLLLTLVAPLLGVIAYGVWRSSPGPILFRQIRIGQHGRPFEILKFRTMLVNDDSDTQWTVDNDKRVTSIGQFLRASHLDELPQLWNVLRGDMSLIGPRPERPAFVDQFSASYRGYEDRHRVPVGLTGWAQVNGLWGNTSMEDRARFDNRYIEDWSFFRELVIMARTVPSLLGRRDEAESTIEAAAPVAIEGSADGFQRQDVA